MFDASGLPRNKNGIPVVTPITRVPYDCVNHGIGRPKKKFITRAAAEEYRASSPYLLATTEVYRCEAAQPVHHHLRSKK